MLLKLDAQHMLLLLTPFASGGVVAWQHLSPTSYGAALHYVSLAALVAGSILSLLKGSPVVLDPGVVAPSTKAVQE
jgi:hypothetical protein